MVANDRNQLKEIVDQKIIILRNVNAFRRMIVYGFICIFHNLRTKFSKNWIKLRANFFCCSTKLPRLDLDLVSAKIGSK